MPYKLHSQFTAEAQKIIDDRLPSIKDAIRRGLLMDMITISRMGVLPEGASAEEQQRVNSKGLFPLVAEEMAKAQATPLAFTLGTRSLELLKFLKPELSRIVQLAITKSQVDFRVQQTIRSLADQQKAVAEGHSRTMKSKHLKQADGFAWAVDLVALDDHKVVSWELNQYTEIAHAMDCAATELGLASHVRWGCAWDRVLSDFGAIDTRSAYADEIQAYAKRHAGSDLIDAPHFEWVA